MSSLIAGPRVRARVIEAANGGLLVGVVTTDDRRAQGGIMRVTRAALAELAGAIADAVVEYDRRAAEEKGRAA